MYTDINGVVVAVPRAPGNYDVELVSQETGLACEDPSRTQQQFKDETDINVILERFGVTGHLPVTTVQPLEGDFTGIGDYQEALDVVNAAQQNFMRLPGKTRERFGNDPRIFVDFCLNPANIEAVRDLGLAPRPAAPALKEIVNGDEGKS